MDFRLRPAQEEALAYEGGRMAINAVPGSGKTFTLSLLAAHLIASEKVDVTAGQEVLVVTYLNASVESFKARVRQQLQAMGLPLTGFDVRTLHSLGLEIVRLAGESAEDEAIILDEAQAAHYLERATAALIEDHPEAWRAFLPEADSVSLRARWRDITAYTASRYIRAAKNERYRPEAIVTRLTTLSREARAGEEGVSASDYSLVAMLNGIYARYENILRRQAALDFDDLIWRAVDLLQTRTDVAATLQQRWPYVLEDEAQDSVPLQEALLRSLSGTRGNWVRAGDPNQAITSSFTSAHPRHFNAFIDRPDVREQPLPSSGRSAPRIIAAANELVRWTSTAHPVPEVRTRAFRPQTIEPTPPGDGQPNPADTPHNVRIKVYGHREEEELPAIARLAQRYLARYPQHTVAILVPTNRVGFATAEELDALDLDYDNLLRGGLREQEVAGAIYAMLALLADPLDRRALAEAFSALVDLDHPALYAAPGAPSLRETVAPYGMVEYEATATPDTAHFRTLLRSVHLPERFLFPTKEEDLAEALPPGVADAADLLRLHVFAAFLRRIFTLRLLPADDLALALAHELFAPSSGSDREHDLDLSIAYEIAALLRRWRQLQPNWRLPQLAEQLGEIARGRRRLQMTTSSDLGFTPAPGRVTLATQHSAKGLEWDAVFLVGIDGFWIPATLASPFLGVHEFLGGDPAAEATAQLRELMVGDAELFPGHTATESAHIEVMSERLRLLYVGITRARRYLHISRSRMTRYFQRERETMATPALGALARTLAAEEGDEGP
jgi:DNA helicase-2/ATP-dependent DNA helicase PcrA